MAVAGPDHVFHLFAGQNVTTYVRIYNEGNSTGYYRITVEGNVSPIAILEMDFCQLEPAENRKVLVTYVAPSNPGSFTGLLLVTLEGTQIVSGVSKEIRVNVERPLVNRAPNVRLVSPEAGGKLSGNVQLLAEGEDPDGDQVRFEIYIDGILVAQRPSYLWRTMKWKNGEHEVKVVVYDQALSSQDVAHFLVDNRSRMLFWAVMVAAIAVPVCVWFFLRRALAKASKGRPSRHEGSQATLRASR